MIHKRVYLYKENETPYLDVYAADPTTDFIRDAVLVIPGGGYNYNELEREGEPIALAFLGKGKNAFVLHYSVRKNSDKTFPQQLIEASKAMNHIRNNAKEYGINSERIFACGSSAGGHLCACLGNMWHMEEIYKSIDIPYGANKPAGIILMYPVVSAKWHEISFEYLLDDKYSDEELKNKCSIENNVSEKSVPAFVFHTSDDEMVDVRNSLVLANAYKENNIPFEMHIYNGAPHGVSLANEITECNNPKWNNEDMAQWHKMAIRWMKKVEGAMI